MRVIHLSTNDTEGGAARAAYRLHNALRRLGVESKMLVGRKWSSDTSVIGPKGAFEKLWHVGADHIDRSICRFMKPKPSHLCSPAWVPNRIPAKITKLNPEIVHMHWVCGGFIRPESVAKIKRPIIWTLHDMWAFAGTEHYVADSKRYYEGYTITNRPNGLSGFDLDRWVWKRKLKAWRDVHNLVIVTPSQWLAGCAKRSILFRNRRIETIVNGVDHNLFKPLDRSVARYILGLPENKRLILFGAIKPIIDPRKGFSFFADAVRHLATHSEQNDTAIVILGSQQPDSDLNLGYRTYYLGRFHDEVSLALVYAAADVFVCPSNQDNLPNTILESMACGTPVVGFHVGGIAEIINHKKDGYLATPFDTIDLADGIHWVLFDAKRRQHLSYNARNNTEHNFSLDDQALAYYDLYRDII